MVYSLSGVLARPRSVNIAASAHKMADWVGATAATLMPVRDVIEAHVHTAERLHVDDTTVPVLARGKCRTGRLWTHVRDDQPFGGKAAPAAVYYYSPNREGEHPEKQPAAYTGIIAEPTPMRASTASMRRIVSRDRLPKLVVGRIIRSRFLC